jgi:hypothetical protein
LPFARSQDRMAVGVEAFESMTAGEPGQHVAQIRVHFEPAPLDQLQRIDRYDHLGHRIEQGHSVLGPGPPAGSIAERAAIAREASARDTRQELGGQSLAGFGQLYGFTLM